jgi:hypothetical protein
VGVAAPIEARPTLSAAETSADACGRCHRKEIEAWRGLRHSVSSTNAIFAASFAHWPNSWCVRSHLNAHVQRDVDVDVVTATSAPPVLPTAPHRRPVSPPSVMMQCIMFRRGTSWPWLECAQVDPQTATRVASCPWKD